MKILDSLERKYLRVCRNPRSREELAVEVVITERKTKFGKSYVLITPYSGSGELWVEERCLYNESEIEKK